MYNIVFISEWDEINMYHLVVGRKNNEKLIDIFKILFDRYKLIFDITRYN